MFAGVFKKCFSDFCQTSLDIHWTDLYEICRDGRTLAVDEPPEVIFRSLKKDVAMATNFC